MPDPTREYVAEGVDTPDHLATRSASPPAGDPGRTATAADAPAAGGPTALPPVPGYEIERELGRGGMGVVYLARQTALNRTVALKMVLAGGRASPTELVRFLAEAEAIARLDHPNVVRVLEVGHHDGLPYFTMEYVGGGSLGDYPAPLPPRAAARLAEQVARGVAYAHGKGVVHRDLKPDNILLAPADPGPGAAADPDRPPVVPKVADFGLAKRVGAGAGGVTVTGAVLGTPSYMAPEQAAGAKEVGPPADVYSLGAVLYRLLTGRPPFLAATPVDTLRQVLDADPPAPSHLVPGVPRDLETVCLRCLRKDPGKRYASAAELADDLARFLAGQPVSARPVGAPEQAWMWVKRNRSLAAALGAVALALVAGTAASVGFALQARRDADRADKEAARAVASETLAEGRAAAAREARDAANWARYVSDVRLVGELGRRPDGSGRAVADLLAAQVPARPDDPDLREFTWRMHWTALHRAAVRVPTEAPVVRAALTGEGSVSALHAGGGWRLYDPATGRVLRELPAPAAAPAGMDLSADGRLVARTGDRAETAVVIDTHGERTFAPVTGTGAVRAVALAPGNGFLASVWADGRVRVHDLATGAERGSVPLKADVFRSLAVSPDGARVALGNHPAAGRVTVYRTADGTSVTRGLMGERGSTIPMVVFAPDGSRLAAAGWMGGVTVLDAATGEVVAARDQVLTTEIRGLAFSPDGRRLAAGDADGAVAWWEPGNPAGRTVLRGHTAAVLAVGFSPDGGSLVGAGPGGLRVWDLRRPSPVRRLVPGRGTVGVAVGWHGGRLATAGRAGGVRVHDLGTGAVVMQTEPDVPARPAPPADTLCLAAAPGLALLATGDASSVVTVWDPATGRRVWRSPETPAAAYGPPSPVMALDTPGRKRAVGCLAVSPDGRLLAAGYGARDVVIRAPYDQAVRVWETGTWAEVASLRVRNSVAGLAFAPGGELIAGCHDGTVRTWRVAGWEPGGELPCGASVTALGLSADGGRLAVGLRTGAVLVRDLRTGAELRRPAAHSGSVSCVAFAPDGRTLVTAGRFDSAVKFWDPAGLRELHRHAYGGAVADLAFSPAGNLLVAAGGDGVWAFPAAPLDEIDRERAGHPPAGEGP